MEKNYEQRLTLHPSELGQRLMLHTQRLVQVYKIGTGTVKLQPKSHLNTGKGTARGG